MKKNILFDYRAQTILEMTILLPLILLLALGVFEFGRAIHAKNMVINMSREASNLFSRTDMSPQNIMDAVASTAQPLKMSSNGMIYLTKVSGLPGGGAKVLEQHAWDGDDSAPGYTPASKIGVAPSPGNPEPPADTGSLVLDDGELAFFAEVFYKHTLIFSQVINYTPEVYSRAAL